MMDTNRRDFIKGAATAVAALPTFRILSQENDAGPDAATVNVAIIGYGAAGQVLSESALRIPGVRITAVCDIWKLGRDKGKSFCWGMKQDAKIYEDYREMLEKEDKNIDAVIVATPDWMHAEHTNACLRAGKHVYCETPMSHWLDQAKSMVLAQRETGKLLQIGNQLRSNPRYVHAIDRVMREANVLGVVPHAYAQWSRPVAPFLTVRERMWVPAETLERYGYANMEHLLNWRWFAKYSKGPMSGFGSRQVDLFFWAWDCTPVAVTALGGNDYYCRENNDNVTAAYEFKTKDGNIRRGLYQVLTTTSNTGYERFMGENGTLLLSETYASIGRETRYDESEPEWDAFVEKGLIRAPAKRLLVEKYMEHGRKENVLINVDPSLDVPSDGVPATLFLRDGQLVCHCQYISRRYTLPVELNKPAHQPHLENFFDAVRQNKPEMLTCPPEAAYRTLVAVLAANESAAKRQTLYFKPDDFRV